MSSNVGGQPITQLKRLISIGKYLMGMVLKTIEKSSGGVSNALSWPSPRHRYINGSRYPSQPPQVNTFTDDGKLASVFVSIILIFFVV